MSNFRTILPIEKASFSIDYQSSILCIGSCFTENIGHLLIQNKFPTLLNPFGIIYNPISIKNSLEILLSRKNYTKEDLFFHQELWHCFDHHGAFSNPDSNKVLEKINTRLNNARQFLEQVNRLIITLGTANIFVNKSTNRVVANCHKLPNIEFKKRRLSVKEIVVDLLPILEQLKKYQPNLEIIFTSSPVRHIRDGLLENQRSKATLLLAIEELTKKLIFVRYFPAYELVLDDLRDYRFYEKDMIHPNELAIEYIWQNFQQKYYSTKTVSLLEKIKKIIQASQHRPFHPRTEIHQQFLNQQLNKIANLEVQFPYLDFMAERKIFQAQLTK